MHKQTKFISEDNQMSKVSEKSKKNEILEAYNELLEKVQETKQPTHQEVKAEKHKEEIVVKAAQFDASQIINTLGQVKVSMAQNLAQLEKQLTQEYERLNVLREAIKIETKSLEDIHQIKKSADSLEALLAAQKEKKQQFEAELEAQQTEFARKMEEQRLEWKLEKEHHDREVAEEAESLKKSRIRNEEEYRYKITLERSKEHDSYESRKNALEKELFEKKESFEKECAVREKELRQAEQELIDLRKKVSHFPQEMSEAIDQAKFATKESIERDFNYKIELKEIEISGDRKLQQQTITSLQARIKEQDALIKELSHKSEQAIGQVQSIALKALEGATGTVRQEREDSKTQIRKTE